MTLFLNVSLFLQVLLSVASTGAIAAASDDVSGQSYEECRICTEVYAPESMVYWCDTIDHLACLTCLLTHTEEQIRDGHEKIRCPFACGKTTYSSEWQTHCLLEAKFMPFLSDRTLEIYSAIKQRVCAIQMEYAPCSTRDCAGFIKDGEEGVFCELCHKQYVADVYPQGTRLCTYCRGALQKDAGCNTIKCGHCFHLNNWERCPKAKSKKKKCSCNCLLL